MRGPLDTRRIRHIVNTTLAVLVAMGLVLTAAYAATGSLPLRGLLRQDQPVRATASELQGPVRLADTATVLFNAQRLQPGSVQIAQLRITNSGSTKGTFTFSPSNLTDTTATLPEPLSSVLDLTMQDATNRFQPTTLFVGKLRDIAPVALGTFQPGEARIYRFTISYPTGRTPAQDNPLQGAVAGVVFNWDAVLDDPPVTTSPVPVGASPASTPAPPVSAPAGPAAVKTTTKTIPATLRISWRTRKAGGGLTAVVVCRLACFGTLSGSAAGGKAPGVKLAPVVVWLPKGVRRIYHLRFAKAPAAVTAALGAKTTVVAHVTLQLRTIAGTSHRLSSSSTLRAHP